LFIAARLGIPVSTHTVTGAIMGVDAARPASAVRWDIAQRIVIAWLITMPAAVLLAAAFYGIASVVP
jgi:PiT family inorganic phosphate transporter